MTKEEAITKINKLRNEYNEQYIDYCGINEAVNMAIEALKADPKHGRWEYTDYGGVGNWHCSVCHNIVVGAKGASLRTPYCPNCGARMDGGEE